MADSAHEVRAWEVPWPPLPVAVAAWTMPALLILVTFVGIVASPLVVAMLVVTFISGAFGPLFVVYRPRSSVVRVTVRSGGLVFRGGPRAPLDGYVPFRQLTIHRARTDTLHLGRTGRPTVALRMAPTIQALADAIDGARAG